MNISQQYARPTDFGRWVTSLVTLIAIASLLLAACAGPSTPNRAEAVRAKLTELQSDSRLAPLAPDAINEAEQAVRAAEKPTRDEGLSDHLILMADGKVELARARAETRWHDQQRDVLREQRERARLDARTREVDAAREDAARAHAATEELRRELDSRETERGTVVTLGDLLFATGQAELRGGATDNLDRLANFLQEHPDRSVVVEGYTDSVGDEGFNLMLSQRRADAVKAYLVRQGVSSNRITSVGKGEADPVASNDTVQGRAQNRRVEVIIPNGDSRR